MSLIHDYEIKLVSMFLGSHGAKSIGEPWFPNTLFQATLVQNPAHEANQDGS